MEQWYNNNMRIRKRLAILVNSIIAVDAMVIAALGIVYGAGEGQLGNYVIGWGYFKPYTMDSNIFTGVVALLVVIYSLININNEETQLPGWLMRAYLMGTTCLVLTFLIATLFLAPIQVINGRNYFTMFSKDMFFFHFLNPLLATFSLVALLKDTKFSLVDRFIGMVPMVVYSFVYFVMVVVLKRWNDFYHFTFDGRYYLIPGVVVIIYGVTYLNAYWLTRAHNYCSGYCSGDGPNATDI